MRPKTHHAELSGRQDLEALARSQQLLGVLGTPNASLDCFADVGQAEVLDREPDFERVR
jgi:hypothetical protein